MIQSGGVSLGQLTSGDWNLGSGTGTREYRSPDIPFPSRFSAQPNVVLALCGLDCGHMTNLRVEVYPENVQPEEFNIVVRTWDDTELYAATVTWIAYD